MVYRLSNLLIVVTASCLSGIQAGDVHQRGLTADKNSKVRHNSNTQPLELNVDASSTYNDKFMALMQSPCRPEFDGYFGATYGNPVKIQYGFKLEILPLSSIMDLLDVVEDKIVDSILSNTFPQMCGFGRRELGRDLGRQLGHASGFRFMKYQEVEKCSPAISQINFCGIFVGEVSVYGRDQSDAAIEVLSIIDQFLNTNDPKRVHPELVKISSVDQYLEITGTDLSNDGVEIPMLGWVGIGLTALIIGACFWWYFLSSQKQGDTANAFSSNARRNKRKWNRYFRKQQRNLDYDPEENSIKQSNEPEAVAFGGGERLLMTNGRPVEIDFDTGYVEPSLDPRALQGLI